MILFNSGATDFKTQGLGGLVDVISGEVTEEINGQFELEFDYPLSGRLYDEIKMRRIVVVKVSPYSEPQPFRIYAISKPINMVVTVNAEHLSYDLTGIPVDPVKMTSAIQGMEELYYKASIACPFSLASNMDKKAAISTDVPKSLRSILGSEYISTYGGEFEFDVYNVIHREKRGIEKPITIRYGHNLLDLTQEENCNTVFTGVYPYYSYNDAGDTSTSEDNKKVLVTLPEKIVYAEGTFDFEKISPLDASGEFDDPPTVDELREWAVEWVKDNNIGVPKVQLTVSFTEAIENLRVDLGDEIGVEFAKMGVRAKARVVSTSYNVVTGAYNSLDLGEAKSSLSSTIVDNGNNVTDKVDKESIKFDNMSVELSKVIKMVEDKVDDDKVIVSINNSSETIKIDANRVDIDISGATAGKVDKASIISTINNSFETIKIDANRVDIDISDKVDKKTIISDINMSKETDKIEANRVELMSDTIVLDLDGLTEAGHYIVSASTNHKPPDVPQGVMTQMISGTMKYQMLISSDLGRLYTRIYTAGAWTPWEEK